MIKNIKLSKSLKLAYAEGRRNRIPWNKGLPMSNETKMKLSKIMSEKPGSFTGKLHSEETKQKMREAKLKNPIRYWSGKERSIETKKKLSESVSNTLKLQYASGERISALKGRPAWNRGLKGELSPGWKGGLSFLPYTPDFTPLLKRQIKNRDSNKCFICGKTEWRMAVHHIDYDKSNNNPKNLITLCYKCHGDTNFQRAYWEGYFKQSLLVPRRIPITREVRF